MVILESSDKVEYKVDKDVANRSELIRNMIEDVGEHDQPIPIVNVTSAVLEKVIAYCEHHRNDPFPTSESSDSEDMWLRTTAISEWDEAFITVDKDMLFQIILAANYLDIKPLLDVGCKTVAKMIKGKSPEEIRELFGASDDLSAEEKEQMSRENEWAIIN